ncbi:calretinin [Candidatus Magnetoovum chiemensis]|nr:calretinin [Candidatus Magnetoovum chiemensis]
MVSSISSAMTYYTGQTRSAQSKKDHAEEMFKKVDNNSDGKVDQEELQIVANDIANKTGGSLDITNAMAQYDTNGDGGLDEDEMNTFMKDNAPRPPKNAMGQMEGMKKSPQDMFNEIDANSDGLLDQTELEELAQNISNMGGSALDVSQAISDYDTDGDNSLNQDEMDSFMKDNAPRPSQQTNQAMSSYAMNMDSDQLSSLLDMLKSSSEDTKTSNSMNSILSALLNSQSTIDTSA